MKPTLRDLQLDALLKEGVKQTKQEGIALRNKLDYLISRKYPRSTIIDPEDPKYFSYMTEVNAYRELLRNKTQLEIDTMCAEAAAEDRAIKDLQAAHSEFDYKEANADYEFWGKAPYLTTHEAASLLLAKDPHEVTPKRMEDLIYYKNGTSKFLVQHHKIEDLLKRTCAAKQTQKIHPVELIEWADQNRFSVPEGLRIAVQEFHAVIDYKAKCEELEKQLQKARTQLAQTESTLVVEKSMQTREREAVAAPEEVHHGHKESVIDSYEDNYAQTITRAFSDYKTAHHQMLPNSKDLSAFINAAKAKDNHAYKNIVRIQNGRDLVILNESGNQETRKWKTFTNKVSELRKQAK